MKVVYKIDNEFVEELHRKIQTADRDIDYIVLDKNEFRKLIAHLMSISPDINGLGHDGCIIYRGVNCIHENYVDPHI